MEKGKGTECGIASIQFTGSLGKNVIRMDISLSETLVTKPLRMEKTDDYFEDTKLNEARDFWEKGLARLMKEIPVFDTIIADLRKELEFLK
jgi:hypothetical protein